MIEKDKETLPEKMISLEFSWEDVAGEEVEELDESSFDQTYLPKHHAIDEDYGSEDGYGLGI